MHSLLLLLLLAAPSSFGSKCVAPLGDWWVEAIPHDKDYFSFSFDPGDPKEKPVVFRDPVSGKTIIQLDPQGVAVNGKKVCGFKEGYLADCPKGFPLRMYDDRFFGESTDTKGGKVGLSYRGRVLNPGFVPGKPCLIETAEAKRKAKTETALGKEGLAEYLASVEKCVRSNHGDCLKAHIPSKTKLGSEEQGLLLTLLSSRKYPTVSPATEAQPAGNCIRAGVVESAFIIHSDCSSLSVRKQFGKWKITAVELDR